MPPVQGILETALYVEDLPRAVAFYRRILGFPILSEGDRLVALDVAGRSVLLLFQQGATLEPFSFTGGTIPSHGSTGSYHFAFSIQPEDTNEWRRHLETQQVAIESEVSWEGGAQSLYFRDPDGHLVELITPGFWSIF